jgi:hypothetical protein
MLGSPVSRPKQLFVAIVQVLRQLLDDLGLTRWRELKSANRCRISSFHSSTFDLASELILVCGTFQNVRLIRTAEPLADPLWSRAALECSKPVALLESAIGPRPQASQGQSRSHQRVSSSSISSEPTQ